jgi:glycosyltransferase involved in cell wall biosynthesis
MKHILLVCYDFPPNKGIGGRRWAKHAKALARLGHEIHVIKSTPAIGYTSNNWMTDLDLPNIHIHLVDRTYPTAISHHGNGLIASLKYRYFSWKLKQAERGTIYDVAVGWENSFSAKAEEILAESNITHLVATGAPFNVLYFAAKLKAKHPYLNFLADYRDPWLTARNYGMANLTPARMQAEVSKQRVVFERADFITCTNSSMMEEITSSDPDFEPKGKLKVIPHCYDLDDIPSHLDDSNTSEPGKINLVYGGALYLGLEPFVTGWVNELLKIKNDTPEEYKRLKISIFTPDLQYAHLFEPVKDCVELRPPIGKDLFKKIAIADGILMLLAAHNKDNFTTKFAESLPFKKPIIFVGASGAASDFVVKHDLGVIAKEYGWAKLISDFPKYTSSPEKEALLQTHSLNEVGKLLNELLA